MPSSVARWVVAAVATAGWAPIAVFGAHVVASRGLDLYRAFPPLDVPMHVAGGAAIAYFFWSALRLPAAAAAVGELEARAAGLLCFASVGTSTVVWELAEWISDRYLGTRAQLGLEDTLLDMALGLVGGFSWVVAAIWIQASRSPGDR